MKRRGPHGYTLSTGRHIPALGGAIGWDESQRLLVSGFDAALGATDRARDEEDRPLTDSELVEIARHMEEQWRTLRLEWSRRLDPVRDYRDI